MQKAYYHEIIWTALEQCFETGKTDAYLLYKLE